MNYASKAGSAVRYASRTTGVDFEKILTWAAIGGVAYLVYGIYSAGSAAKAALTSTGEAIGSGLYDLFHPDQTGEMLFYTVTFPDGQRHAIGSRDVDKNGRFAYGGRNYQMIVDKFGKKFATPAS